jgi:tRNA uridine 5-carbamoylmethylation protein Kti12
VADQQTPHTPNRPTLFITVGLPGSGKTTYAEERLAKAIAAGRTDLARVNRDSLRLMLHGPAGYGTNEEAVTVVQHAAVRMLLNARVSVICDDTNLVLAHRLALADVGRKSNANVIIVDKFLRVPLDECIARDALRPQPLGPDVIRGIHQRHVDSKAAAAC